MTALGHVASGLFANDDALAREVASAADTAHDPVWRMPLWQAYAPMLASKVADTNNVSAGPFAGSITAALFLQKFTGKAKTWAHFDLYGWTPPGKMGRPEGGEGQTVRLVYHFLEQRYGK